MTAFEGNGIVLDGSGFATRNVLTGSGTLFSTDANHYAIVSVTSIITYDVHSNSGYVWIAHNGVTYPQSFAARELSSGSGVIPHCTQTNTFFLPPSSTLTCGRTNLGSGDATVANVSVSYFLVKNAL